MLENDIQWDFDVIRLEKLTGKRYIRTRRPMNSYTLYQFSTTELVALMKDIFNGSHLLKF